MDSYQVGMVESLIPHHLYVTELIQEFVIILNATPFTQEDVPRLTSSSILSKLCVLDNFIL